MKSMLMPRGVQLLSSGKNRISLLQYQGSKHFDAYFVKLSRKFYRQTGYGKMREKERQTEQKRDGKIT